MKIISWNVNGVNAAIRNGLLEFLKIEKADVYCFQELKATPEKLPKELSCLGYKEYHVHAEKKGYSGVSVLTKVEPLSVIKGLEINEFDKEGRVLTLEFEKFYLINTYFPNAQPELARIDFKERFNSEFLKFVKKLEEKKPVVATGDFNVAHTEIDLKNPKANENNAGFSAQERAWMDKFISHGLVDTFRIFEKGPGHYTWWSYRFFARKKDIGWRIDYFLVSEGLKNNIKESSILKNVMGSDHCPIRLVVE